MKILVVSPQLPSLEWGAGIRTYYLLKTLASKHTVSLFALRMNDTEETLQRMSLVKDLVQHVQLIPCPRSFRKRLRGLIGLICGRSYIFSNCILNEMQQALDTFFTSNHYDVVLFKSVSMTGYRLPEHMKTIIDQHDNVYEILRRTYQHASLLSFRKWHSWLESRLVKSIEIERYRQADALSVTSERELLNLKHLLPESTIALVPNGVDIEYFRTSCPEQEVSDRIVFTGTMDYYPNIDAVLSFAQQCWPLIWEQVPTATWQIVGRNPPSQVQQLARLPGVTVTGLVPDVRPYLSTAAVAIVPIHVGSGTRLKILEALSMGKAVVSTSLGCEGLAVEPGKHLLVVDQPKAIAQAIVDLLKNPAKRRILGNAGRLLVESEYSWEQCGNRLLHLLEEILA